MLSRRRRHLCTTPTNLASSLVFWPGHTQQTSGRYFLTLAPEAGSSKDLSYRPCCGADQRRDLGHFQRWPHHKRRLIQPRATCKRYSSQRGRPGKIASLSFTPQPAWSVLQMCSRTPIMSLAELNARAPRRAASRHARALPIAGIFTTLQACTPFPHLPYPKTTKMS